MVPVETFPPIDNIIPYLGIAAVFEALAVYLFQFRKIPGAMLLVYCQICKGVWVSAKVFGGMSPDLPTKIIWARFTEWAPLLLIYFWFEFIWEVSQQKGKMSAIVPYIIRGVVVALVLVIGFDNWPGWYWGPVSLDGQVLMSEFGPAAWATMIFCYLLNLLCLGLSVRWIYSARGLRRQQAVVLSVTPLFSFIGNILVYFSDIRVVSPQVVGLLLSAVYVTWVFYRWRVYSILPLAQDAVTKSMIDGLVVVDEKGYIVDMNPAAKDIFTGLPATVGNKFQENAAAWPVLAEISGNSGAEIREASRNNTGERRYYQISTMPLKTPQGDPLGKTILFKDITQQKHDQEKMLEQQKALAILAERDRLGRELHDGQGQIWNYLGLELQSVQSQISGGRAEAAATKLEKLLGVVREQNIDTRESIIGLKKSATASDDFVANLDNYLKWYEKTIGIKASLSLPTTPITGILNQTGEVQLLRIILEALTNVRKHAEASEVKVIIDKTESEVTVTIEDNGCGFDAAAVPSEKKSFGLQIMAERATEAGGRLEIQSKPGEGTRVTIRFRPNDKEGIRESI